MKNGHGDFVFQACKVLENDIHGTNHYFNLRRHAFSD